MISRLQKKYALSDQGAKDLLKAIIYSVLANISLMLPVALLAVVLNAMLPVVLGTEEKITGIAGDTIVGILILIIILSSIISNIPKPILALMRKVKNDSITLAEKLRTLPLSFFHERDLADLTSTIMGDCASFEHAIRKMPILRNWMRKWIWQRKHRFRVRWSVQVLLQPVR